MATQKCRGKIICLACLMFLAGFFLSAVCLQLMLLLPASTALHSLGVQPSAVVQSLVDSRTRTTEATSTAAAEEETKNNASATTTTTTTTTNKFRLRDDILKLRLGPDELWESLINEAAALRIAGRDPGLIMEVGMFNAEQCLFAARQDLETHCFEPSPKNAERVLSQIREALPRTRSSVRFHQVAAGSKSNTTVPFNSGGSTGDHVGANDMWNMQREEPATGKDHPDAKAAKNPNVIQVPMMRLDDFIKTTSKPVFLLKVDTQGYEPFVFDGLQESLSGHKIKFLLMEYWPRGMDFMTGRDGQCVAAELLENLAGHGYSLFAMTSVKHPKSKATVTKLDPQRPLGNLKEDCQWYYNLEKRFPTPNYKIGYWSDIFAVAPEALWDDYENNPTRQPDLLHTAGVLYKWKSIYNERHIRERTQNENVKAKQRRNG